MILAVFANLLAAILALSGGAFYVLVYTLWLKRSTSQNIVIGGAAGAIPPLAGWAAAHGSLGLGAVFLFAIVLLWTPPHFWALALLLAPHYEKAQRPDAAGHARPGRHHPAVLAYTVALVAADPRPRAARHVRRPSISSAAALLDGVFCALAWRLWRRSTAARAAVLFHYSLLYLALLFLAVAVDAVVR